MMNKATDKWVPSSAADSSCWNIPDGDRVPWSDSAPEGTHHHLMFTQNTNQSQTMNRFLPKPVPGMCKFDLEIHAKGQHVANRTKNSLHLQ
jgi:hypothetical protein